MLFFSGCRENDPGDETPDTVFQRLLTAQILESNILKREISYQVFLPADYNQGKDSFPVVYLLHGLGDHESSWYQGSRLYYYTEKYSEQLSDIIYVMPEGFNSYYVNRYNGRFNYMDMFTRELVPLIDSLFRTFPDPSQRAVMGYSMGGYGALILPSKNPDVFSISVPLSMSFRTDDQYLAEPVSVFQYQWGSVFGGNEDNRFTEYFLENSPFHYFSQEDPGLTIFIDCGDDEETLCHTNDSLHCYLMDQGIKHEYRIRDGGHSWDTWNRSLPVSLKFISDCFKGYGFTEDLSDPVIGDPIPGGNEMVLSSENFQDDPVLVFPPDYKVGSDYPLLLILHECEEGNRKVQSESILRLLFDRITGGSLIPSILLEIPVINTPVTPASLETLLDDLAREHHAGMEREKRIIIGYGNGGGYAAEVSALDTTLFGSCFVFLGKFREGQAKTALNTFYYLDNTDDSDMYAHYHSLYKAIRKNGLGYEYRVREGRDPFKDFLRGLDESIPVLKKQLNTGIS